MTSIQEQFEGLSLEDQADALAAFCMAHARKTHEVTVAFDGTDDWRQDQKNENDGDPST